MYMAYTTNPHLPRVRAQAVELVRRGKSVREAARHFGFAHNTVLNWLKRKPEYGWHGQLVIPTKSSRPMRHPKELSNDIIRRILDLREERNQCAEILNYRLLNEHGAKISLSSVKRVLKRHHCSRFSQWKKWHQYPDRPMPEKPGILVEIDTMLDGPPFERLCAYALMDICSRWAFASPIKRISSQASVEFLMTAQDVASFRFKTIQSDHGSEFSKWFTKVIEHKGFSHRHSRVRRPTDNGHIERFIRTLQEECLNRLNRNLRDWKRGIPEYVHYYNTERPHMGLNMQTPLQVVRSY
ncbi:MAG: hypothetical protein A3I20_00370 [Candidatus Portnoybacteria bacterium RIFCSPLOWO2_02_FULL_40_15]|uniref:Integrase catalytic domain-containing protein n=1 Tax=Candidatus Portnoybacteria bacterium RIFCSPLOWO2_02_FULL_40_15 TaxID=1802002 RepID=A0A1G2FSH0_9BACT|nr:MAG: hypothetical protein A3I20_00370 [Candidatus Portnoybacteria bacterium RIFCSPLOWO2_02_FULL_40_15]